MTSTTMPTKPTLAPRENHQLKILWQTHSRELVDVKFDESKNAAAAAAILSPDAYGKAVRLYLFFVAFLEAAILRDNHPEASSSARKDPFIRDYQSSALRPYAAWALTTTTASANNTPGSNHPPSPHQIRLQSGRRVLALHHEDFLQELNTFELRGSEPTSDFNKESFGAFLYFFSTDALKVLGCAMALAMVRLSKESDVSVIERFLDSTQIIVRFAHLLPRMEMMQIKTGLVGKLLTIKGHVVKARPKRLRVATADFACLKCGASQTHAFDRGQYSIPKSCRGDNCRSRSFTLLRSTARYMDVQEIRLQEAQEENIAHAGRSPRQIEVELTHDLVDTCRPGDIVLVAARVDAINTAIVAGKMGKRAKETSTYKLYLISHSVTTMSESDRCSANDHGSQVTYTQQQLRSITQLCHADHRYFGLVERRAFPFDLLVRSICPAIIGHNEVKAGLLLCLLGGTPPSSQSADKGNSIRSNSHCLIVGDPGMGKSQMLLAATQLAARSVYVGGNTSSTTGLTVTLTKEEKGEAGIEAGALVLADQGICAIDEFDKMAKNHQDGLLEAMEQQQVSIAKAGVVASLPARCSVIAAANPRHGSYNMGKTVAENLNMAKPILSRFDLVFILRDRADKSLDGAVSSNIMNLYRGKDMATQNRSPGDGTEGVPVFVPENGCNRMPLSDRLSWVNNFQKEPLPANLVKDFIAYAREYCKPKLTAEAAAVLKEYFMNLRYPIVGKRRNDMVPITTRQLEALIRLCQARAKACLRDYVLQEDALDVVELMTKSVEQVHSDEGGFIDPGRGGAGGNSNRKIKKAFVNELQRIVGVGADCSMDDLRRIAAKVNCGLNEFPGLLEDLRNNSIILKRSSGKYQVL